MQRVKCRKCLLEDMDFDVYYEKIKDYINNTPYDKRCSESEYRRRLGICKSCEELSNGVCAKCGCYVELRAIKPQMYCASEKKLW